MEILGGRVDLVALLVLALLLNVAGLLWACGVAMRVRSVQGGPLMQTPVFLILFLAPVYVPLDLLAGWLQAIAQANPMTALLEAGRGLIGGREEDTALAFATAAALVVGFALWAYRGLRSAERAGA
jgi:ABC-type polysaccharide/polyol phosphate export permease